MVHILIIVFLKIIHVKAVIFTILADMLHPSIKRRDDSGTYYLV